MAPIRRSGFVVVFMARIKKHGLGLQHEFQNRIQYVGIKTVSNAVTLMDKALTLRNGSMNEHMETLNDVSEEEMKAPEVKANEVNDSTIQDVTAEIPKANTTSEIQNKFHVEGIPVLLPPGVTPYRSQKAIMVKIIQHLNRGNNILIESPTGSGKTLALLSPACAWLENYNENIQKSEEQCLKHGKDAVSDGAKCTCKKIIKVYYSTRTHKQIAQIVKEFRRLPYGYAKHDKSPFRHTVFASRKQLCLQEAIKESKDPSESCKHLIENKSCKYYQNYSDSKISNIRNAIKAGIKRDDEIFDIEDLAKALEELEICPYYSSRRKLFANAQIIFTPYNYLIDAMIRNSCQINLQDAIVVLDEAHNIEDVSRDAASFEFTESEIREAIKFMNICLKKFKTTRYENVLKRLRIFLYQLLDFFFNLLPEFNNLDTRTWNMKENEFLDKLKQKNLYFGKDDQQFSQFEMDFGKITLSEKSADSVSFKAPKIIITVLQKYLYFMKYFQIESNQHFYKCNVIFKRKEKTSNEDKSEQKPGMPVNNEDSDDDGDVDYTDNKQSNDVKLKGPFRAGFEGTLSFWCMSPSVAFLDAFKSCHSVILASGTLHPTESLKTELGMNFEPDIIGNQVIQEKQIFARIISKGSTGYPIECTFNNKVENLYMELLRTILEVCINVPKGILVFVSSYSMIKEFQKYITNQNLKEEIEKHKTIFYEPQSSEAFNEMFENYKIAVNKGALLFGVYRGKISEGIDFPDDLARCVICVGIPFAYIEDEQIKRKRSFNDEELKKQEQLKKLGSVPNINTVSGKEWYTIQAYRALNQALGRCLRHRNDYGAILLFDKRFLEPEHRNKISKWVCENIVRGHNPPIDGNQLDHLSRLKEFECKSIMNDLVDFFNERLNDTELQPNDVIIDAGLSTSISTTPNASRNGSPAKKKKKSLLQIC